MIPHSPRACLTSVTLPYSASHAPKNRVNESSVFFSPQAASARAPSATMPSAQGIFDMLPPVVRGDVSSDRRPRNGGDDILLEEQIHDEDRQTCEHRLRHEKSDPLGLC